MCLLWFSQSFTVWRVTIALLQKGWYENKMARYQLCLQNVYDGLHACFSSSLTYHCGWHQFVCLRAIVGKAQDLDAHLLVGC